MFQKKPPSPQPNTGPRAAAPTSRTETVLGPGVDIKGDLESPASVELHGTLEGNLTAGDLIVVQEPGRVVGDVAAKDVIVHGTIEGRVTAAQRIELGSSGRIQGDLRARAVSIADGAYFEGRVEMTAPSDSSPRSEEEVLMPARTAL